MMKQTRDGAITTAANYYITLTAKAACCIVTALPLSLRYYLPNKVSKADDMTEVRRGAVPLVVRTKRFGRQCWRLATHRTDKERAVDASTAASATLRHRAHFFIISVVSPIID